MLKSVLYDIEKFVREALDLPDQTGKIPNKKESGTIKSLCAKLKEKWIQGIFSSTREQVIARYIQFHQAGITRLSNDLSVRLAAIDFPEKDQHSQGLFYQEILIELELLLFFLWHECRPYFDLNYPVSLFHGKQQYDQVLEKLTVMETRARSIIDQSLLSVVSLSVKESAEEAIHTGISYRQLSRNIDLLRLMDRIFWKNPETSRMQLADLLYKNNLNTLRFFRWFRDHCLDQLHELPDRKDKEKWLHAEIKRLEVLFVDPKKPFEPELPAIDQQILPWLRLQLENTPRKMSKKTDGANGNGPMPLVLSVTQFAMFVRVFQQTGCFSVQQAAKIIRFFSRHFTTKRQSDISIKSFNHAFYSMDQSAAAVVRDYLQKMINYVNKTYFPK